MKVLLVFPPHWQPLMPHLALPALTAYLRTNGVEVVQLDINAELFDGLLSNQHLELAQRQLRQAAQRPPMQGLDPAQSRQHRAELGWAEQHGTGIAEGVETAKSIVRSDRFYDPVAGLQALIAITDALRLASLPHYPSQLRLLGYDAAYPVDASQAIRSAVSDSRFNMFRDLLQVSALPRVRHEQPDVVGISLTSAGQAIAAFTLAALIKEAGIHSHVVLGGKMISCWRDQLPAAPALWDLFDSAVVYEGEVALLRLIEALDRGQPLSTVPNLIYRDGSGIHVNELEAPEPVDVLPIPDFGGVPLDLYLAPARVLPVSASRGCYWGRCAFCNVGYGESKRFDEQCAKGVAEEMAALARIYSTRHFFFSDEALSPRMLKALSAQLIQRGADLQWTCCARFEPAINGDLLRRMRQAGCRMVLYGLESGSQRVLDRMDKGIKLSTAQRILKEGAEAGIWNHIFFFFGFPGETEWDARETTRFFRANRQHIHSVCTGTFLLERYSRVAAEPERYGLARVIPPGPARDLAYYYDYEVRSGIGAQRAEEIEAQFVDSLSIRQVPQAYFHDIYRFLYACRFRDTERLPTLAD